MVSNSSIMPDPAKIETVNNISSPLHADSKIYEVFWVLRAGYYSKFIAGYNWKFIPGFIPLLVKLYGLYCINCLRLKSHVFKSCFPSELITLHAAEHIKEKTTDYFKMVYVKPFKTVNIIKHYSGK